MKGSGGRGRKVSEKRLIVGKEKGEVNE